jgi:DMSO/TMAO reductase YedYZ molybdopterin-dependent catalytic subunit
MSDDTKSRLFGQIKEKLIASKRKWARDGRLLTGKTGEDRLPPGQRQVRDWPVLDLGLQPYVAPQDWKLTVDGAVAHPIVWDWNEFLAAPQVEDTSDIHCVTAWSRYDNHWEGVSARHLIELVKPKPDARHVVFHSHDGYTTNGTLEMFSAADVLIAHSWEGEPLTREHGGPARVIMPQYYFWKSAKWLRRIEFTAEDQPGFWEVRGYHNTGDPWKEERYG